LGCAFSRLIGASPSCTPLSRDAGSYGLIMSMRVSSSCRHRVVARARLSHLGKVSVEVSSWAPAGATVVGSGAAAVARLREVVEAGFAPALV
jgi:hypothetical protein